jgi:hypothetical protein
MMASNATAMEIPAVIDCTTINTRTGISVTRKAVLTTYFEHLRFVVLSCLKKHQIHYRKSMTMQTRVMTKSTKNWRVSSLSLVVSMDVLYSSFCGGIVLGPVDVTGTNQDISTRARKAENIVRKEAKQKNAEALQEFSNKRRCIQFDQSDRNCAQSQLTSAPIRKKVFEIRTTAFENGDRVDVLPDNSPGKCSHGGTGWMTEVKRTGGLL